MAKVTGSITWTLLLLGGIDLLLTVFPGANLEVYESMLAAIVAGVYTVPAVNDWNNDLQFVVLALYARLNALLPGVPVYGIVLYVSTILALALPGTALFRALYIAGTRYGLWLGILLYTVVALDQVQNLNSDRVAFWLTAGILAWSELARLEQRRLPRWTSLLFALLFIYACFVRSEVVLLVVLFAAAMLFAFRRLHPGILLPLSVSLAFFLCYNFLVLKTATTEKQVAFYKEKQIIDRNDIDYARIDSTLKLEVDAFKIHYLTDKPHFDMAFYDAISKRGRSGEGLSRLIDGVSADTLVPAIQKTLGEIRQVWYWVFAFLAWSLLLLMRRPEFYGRYALLVAACLLFPMVLGVYVMVPERFLMPYFSSLAVLALLQCLRTGRSVSVALAPFLLVLSMQTALGKKRAYEVHSAEYARSLQQLRSVISAYGGEKPVVIQNISLVKFFNPNPFGELPASRCVFLNFYYFGSYSCYTQTWQLLCGCDPFSLAAKTNFVASRGNVLISSPDRIGFMLDYLNKKYGMHLEAEKLSPFDTELNVYRILPAVSSGDRSD